MAHVRSFDLRVPVPSADDWHIAATIYLPAGEVLPGRPPAEEVATFKAATDISVFVVPRMAHMHNFATTRALLWERLDEFVAHATRTKEGPDAGL